MTFHLCAHLHPGPCGPASCTRHAARHGGPGWHPRLRVLLGVPTPTRMGPLTSWELPPQLARLGMLLTSLLGSVLQGAIWGSPKWSWIFPPKSSSRHVSLQTAALAPSSGGRGVWGGSAEVHGARSRCAERGWRPAGATELLSALPVAFRCRLGGSGPGGPGALHCRPASWRCRCRWSGSARSSGAAGGILAAGGYDVSSHVPKMQTGTPGSWGCG